MICLYEYNILNYNQIVFISENSLDSFLWNFFIVLLIIIGIIISILLFYFSKKPDEWEHTTNFGGTYKGGKLEYLTNTIRINSNFPLEDSLLKNHIQMLFFEKVQAACDISTFELVEMKNKNPSQLRKIIGDNEISDWIFNSKKKQDKKKFLNFLKKNKIEKREEFFKNINTILSRMELWGK